VPTKTPVPVLLQAPEFTEIKAVREHNPGIDGVYVDLFHYIFSLDLNDADTSKSLTVKLQYKENSGGAWTDCPLEGDTVNTLSYSGTGNTWEGTLLYDVYPIDVIGLLHQVRIACSYTLTDGTAGTVYSTDSCSLYAYKGDYHSGVSGEIYYGKLSATFQIDKDLVLDVNKPTLQQFALMRTSDWYSWDLKNNAEISSVAEDGTFTVTCDIQEETIDPSAEYYLYTVLVYEDMGGAISGWESFAAVENPDILVHNVPEVTTVYYGPDPEWFFPYQHLDFEMTLNDLQGGSATGTLYIDTGSGYSKSGETVTYDPAKVTGSTWADYFDCVFDFAEGSGVTGYAKIRFDMVYPDGSTGTLETEPRLVYDGTYARFNLNYGSAGVAWRKGTRTNSVTGNTEYTISFDVILNNQLVDPSAVTADGNDLYQSFSAWYQNAEIQQTTDGNETHMIFTYVSDSDFPDGDYYFAPNLSYVIEDSGIWCPVNFYLEFTLSSG